MVALRNNKDFPNKVFRNKQIFCWVGGSSSECGDCKALKVIYVQTLEEHEQPL